MEGGLTTFGLESLVQSALPKQNVSQQSIAIQLNSHVARGLRQEGLATGDVSREGGGEGSAPGLSRGGDIAGYNLSLGLCVHGGAFVLLGSRSH